jgi:hypothetical protein
VRCCWAYDGDGKLRYAGKVGSGFDDATLRALRRRLAALAVATSPFAGKVAACASPRGCGRCWWPKSVLRSGRAAAPSAMPCFLACAWINRPLPSCASAPAA